MLKKLKLKAKIIGIFILITLIAALPLSITIKNLVSNALEKAAFEKLEAVQKLKKDEMEKYFEESFSIMETLAGTTDVMKLNQKLLEYKEKKRLQASW